jgi:hypothetical protein
VNTRSVLIFSPGAAGPLLADDLSWMDRGECQYVDPEIFFPEKGGSVRAPKRICAGCEVRAQCLEYAIEMRQEWGIWGGLSWEQRRPLAAGRLAPEPRCAKGLHPKTPENTYANGKCRPCTIASEAKNRADERVARTGSSSPRSGTRAALAA